mmetsp:Transcript_24764/g.71463  ORF Transcript_24764/g.71463 Transcript_24764/m.71463 type:complete len:100 (+) Transcript_24764:237-536(+)
MEAKFLCVCGGVGVWEGEMRWAEPISERDRMFLCWFADCDVHRGHLTHWALIIALCVGWLSGISHTDRHSWDSAAHWGVWGEGRMRSQLDNLISAESMG